MHLNASQCITIHLLLPVCVELPSELNEVTGVILPGQIVAAHLHAVCCMLYGGQCPLSESCQHVMTVTDLKENYQMFHLNRTEAIVDMTAISSSSNKNVISRHHFYRTNL